MSWQSTRNVKFVDTITEASAHPTSKQCSFPIQLTRPQLRRRSSLREVLPHRHGHRPLGSITVEHGDDRMGLRSTRVQSRSQAHFTRDSAQFFNVYTIGRTLSRRNPYDGANN